MQIEKNTDDSVYNLEKIDDLKTTLENVKQALHEADNWSILASDIEEVNISTSGDIWKYIIFFYQLKYILVFRSW